MLRYNRVACGLLLAMLHHAGWTQSDADQALIEQGQFWQARQDSKRASEAWNKLLLVSPGNPQALYGLATVELRAGRIEGARAFLQRLKQSEPAHPLVAQLEQDIQLSSDQNKALLEEARQAVASADVDQALEKYRQALDGRVPVGTVGGNYYSLLGYTSGGLPQAIEGLQRLLVQSPDDPMLQLALARHLARNEATRLDGIRRLARLSEHPEVGSEATESWRDALVWLGPPPPEARPLFAAYLSKHPDDVEIRRQSEQRVAAPSQAVRTQPSSRPDPLRQRTTAAMKSIEAGDTARARNEFQSVLAQRPNDSEALGGMGVLAMREGNWQQAFDYLTRARRGNAAWQPSLSTAQYWVEVEKAQALHQAGKTTEAVRLLNQAVKRAPKEVAANVLLADIMLDQGKAAEAVQAYRTVLKRRPGDSQALLGLSRAAKLSGDDAAARRTLEDALAKDPDNPWLRYELAQLYQEAGQTREARGLIEGLLLTHPDDPEVLYASALLASNNQQWAQARDTLDRIPAARRTAPMNQLYATANRRVQIAEAVGMAHAGRKADALAWLGQIEAGAANDFDVVSAVAAAYVDIGEPARGLALLKPLREQGQARSVDASIAYAGLLLASEQDVEASVVLRQLQAESLTVSQRRLVAELSDAYRIRQADLHTERGDLVAAYDVLAPVLASRPNDPAAQGALARMYAASGQAEKAFGIYETLLRSDPDNPDLHLGLAQVAQQSRDYRQAQREADIAVSLAPENIQVLTSAARIYRASGKSGDAAKLLERAVALEQRVVEPAATQLAAAAVPAPAAAPEASANPFVGLPGQRAASALDAPQTMVVARSSPPPEAVLPVPVTVASSRTEAVIAPPAQTALPAPVRSQPSSSSVPPHPLGELGTAPMFTASAPLPGQPAPSGAQPNPFAESAAADAPQSKLARELDEIYQERSAQFRVGTEVRSRNGEDGTSKLTETQLPIEVSFPVGNDRMSVRATPIVLSAGSIGDMPASTGPADLLRYSPYLVNDERQRGVGLSVGYQTRGMEFDAGVTPLGFQEVNFTGGALFDGTLDDAGTVSYRFDVSRRPVTDSVLSFAGRKYDDLGLEWGGVSATGARLTLSKDFGTAGLYGSAAWHSLRGHNVASNHRTEFNAGAYFRVIDELDTQLMAGVNINATFYNKNLGHFTYGHGGYFSPKHYYALGLPVTWAQRSGRFSYRLDGSVGLQHFKQADAAVFPNNSDLQAYAEQMAGANNLFGDGYYRGESKTGISYNLKASAEYRLDPNLVLGATLGADNADNYRQWMGGLYLRYYFHPQGGLLDLPVQPYRSPYGITYGR